MRKVVDLDQLINDLKETAKKDPKTVWYSPVSDAKVLYAEDLLGFKLPVIPKRIYTELSNGGIGPGYKLGGLPGGNDCAWGDILASTDELRRSEEYEDGWLPVLDWGCNQVTMVDCEDDGKIVTWLEGDVQHEDYDLNEFLYRWTKGERPDISTGEFVRIEP